MCSSARKLAKLSCDNRYILDGDDIVNRILSQGEDYQDEGSALLLRVSTCYWKSQRKLGHLTKITDQGEVLNEIITEDYTVTDKPLYDNRLFISKVL